MTTGCGTSHNNIHIYTKFMKILFIYLMKCCLYSKTDNKDMHKVFNLSVVQSVTTRNVGTSVLTIY
jgi:hypothetical protein